MRQTTCLRSLHLPVLPFSGDITCAKRPHGPGSVSISAMKRDADGEKGHRHKLVDDNMIVLKMRIQDMKMEEALSSSSSMMKWEKEWYKNYEDDVYEAVGFLQTLLMNTRPSVVLGVVVLWMSSTSTSLALVLSYSLRIVM